MIMFGPGLVGMSDRRKIRIIVRCWGVGVRDCFTFWHSV